jgi:uncharacterized protein YbaR (Trm112 family)
VAEPQDTLGLAPWLLDLLRCPTPHHAALRVDAAAHALSCTECDAVFPVVDGLPIMLLDSDEGSS